MTTFAVDTETLGQIDESMRRAWARYSERLRDLGTTQYEQVEASSWDELQLELRQLERRRRALEPGVVG